MAGIWTATICKIDTLAQQLSRSTNTRTLPFWSTKRAYPVKWLCSDLAEIVEFPDNSKSALGISRQVHASASQCMFITVYVKWLEKQVLLYGWYPVSKNTCTQYNFTMLDEKWHYVTWRVEQYISLSITLKEYTKIGAHFHLNLHLATPVGSTFRCWQMQWHEIDSLRKNGWGKTSEAVITQMTVRR